MIEKYPYFLEYFCRTAWLEYNGIEDIFYTASFSSRRNLFSHLPWAKRPGSVFPSDSPLTLALTNYVVDSSKW